MPLDAAIKPKKAQPAKSRASDKIDKATPSTLATPATRAERASEKIAAIAADYHEIGRVNASAMPRSANPDDIDWWTCLVAGQIGSLNDKVKDDAKKRLVSRGKLPDFSAHPLPVGTVRTLYASDLLTASVKVTAQADRVEVAGLVADLVAAGVKPGLLKRLVKRHTRSFAGAHSVTVVLTG